jgi:LPXTG-site transpeptidase (sortase) family protein
MRGVVIGAVLGLLLATAAARPAFAAGSSDRALVRVGWFVQGFGGDVYMDGTRSPSPLTYKSVSAYQSVAPGRHRLEFRQAGASPGTTAVATVDANFAAGSAYTVAAAGSSPLTTVSLSDDFAAPSGGGALLRLVHLAPAAPPVDVSFKGGPTLTGGLGFARATSYLAVTAGDHMVELRESGGAHSLLGAGTVAALAGSVQTVFVAGGVGQPLVMLPVADTASAPTAGAPNTGEGGAAIPALGGLLVLAGIAVALLRMAAGQRRLTPAVTALSLGGCALLAGAGVEAAWPGPTPLDGLTGAVPSATSFLEPVRLSAAPSRLEIPRIGVSAPVVSLGTDRNDTIETPAVPGEAGWYSGGPAPGGTGPAVITGHLDSATGPAVFWRLGQLRSGDVVGVRRTDGAIVWFAVTRVSRYSRASFPDAEVYGATRTADLRLITCGGAFDLASRRYSENVVVYATRVA